MNPNEERVLRENIRHLIRHVKQKRLQEEQQMRKLVRKLIKHELLQEKSGVPGVDPTPNKNTGINFLEDLLKRVIPSLEDDYKRLTSSPEQRKSYRAHIINALINTLAPARLNNLASQDAEPIAEEIEVQMDDEPGPNPDEDKFIEIDPKAQKEEPTEEESEEEQFAAGMEGENATGRNVAFRAFKQIQQPVIDTYDLLSDEDDQQTFYDYLVANVKLYFDKFEGELDTTIKEPTNQAYDTAKGGNTGLDQEGPLAEEEEIFEIEL
tara:strand:- start:631 stop:1428 length:798 start_codon:yes stop_codon:yes gene_type:complete